MTLFLWITTTILVLISINALYVAAEFATVASRKTLLVQMADEGHAMARLLLPIMQDTKALDRYVAACQIGITISSLVLGAYGQNMLAGLLVEPLTAVSASLGAFSAEALATVIVLIVITGLQVILGELLPKSIAIQYPEQVAAGLAVPMRVSLALLSPLIWLFNGSGNLILRALGYDTHHSHAHLHSPQELEILVTESHEGGVLDAEERQMLRNAFRLRDLSARQVMVHRTKLVAVPSNMPLEELLHKAIATGKSRIPLYEGSIDNMVGFVHIKDVFRLRLRGGRHLREVQRKVVHVPEALPAFEVWAKLKEQKQYMAIVFDEFGGTAGLITQEDLIEEIFGELQDESDNEKAIMYVGKHGRRRLRGDLLVSDVNEYLGLDLPLDMDTLGGLVLSELGRAAQLGDEVQVGTTTLLVEVMEDLAVAEVSLTDPRLVDKQVEVREWEGQANDE